MKIRTHSLILAALLTATLTCTFAQEPQLPLPQVPSTLREPRLRAAYIIEHFWDSMDFADARRSHDRQFVEMNFSTFVSVFPHADQAAQRRAVERLMTAAQADSAAYYTLAGVAERYLYETDSPVYSEDYYIMFLERLVESPFRDTYGILRYRYLLEQARKNRPSDLAADFAYVTREGSHQTLHATPADNRLLLLFYDPDCEHCMEVIAMLHDDSTVAAAVAGGSLKVLAVYAGHDRALWEREAVKLPKDWTVARTTVDITGAQRYVLRSMPTLYLLDSDKRVIAKEPRPSDVAGLLNR